MARSVAKLVSGRTAATLVTAVSLPILGRLYDDQSMAIFGIFSTLVLCLQPVSWGFCYSQAMPLARTLSQRRDLFVLSLLLGGASVFVLGLATMLAGPAVVAALGKPELAPYLFYLPLLCLGTTIGGVTSMTLNCERQFGLLALRAVTQDVVRRGFQIASGLLALARPAHGLLVGGLLGTYCDSFAFSFKAVRSLWRRGEQPLSWRGLKEAAYRFRSFPMFRFWNDTATACAGNFPLLFLGAFAPLKVSGTFWMAKTLLILPVRLFTISSREVFYVEVAQRLGRGESTGRITEDLLRWLNVLMAFPLTLVLVLGPLLFEVVVGPQWHEAGVYAQILVPWIVLSSISQPLSAMFDATNRLDEGLLFNVTLLASQSAAMAAGLFLVGPRTALACCTVVTVVVSTSILARTLRLAGAGRRRVARSLVSSYGEVGLLLAPAGLLYWCGPWRWLALAAAGAAGAVYTVILDRRLPQIRRSIVARLRRG
ncbi:MAG: oligosaccharide flippase family protein [Pirellulales bacterium]|nr:oligosaccharide flippase family protein [Pirellulales bacterium]